MEKCDKGSTLTRMGVSGLMFLLVQAYPGCHGQTAVKWLLLFIFIFLRPTRVVPDKRPLNGCCCLYISIFVILIVACSLFLYFYDAIHCAYTPTSKLHDEQQTTNIHSVSRNHESGQALDFFGG